MSQARVTKVAKAQKDQGKCEKCGVELPKGSPYLWFKVGFRSRYKHVRCLKATCYPQPSERESSSLSSIYAAQEEFDRAVAESETPEDIQQSYDDFKEAVEEYASERREAVDAWEYGNSMLEDAADEWEGKAEELDGAFDVEDFPGDLTDDGEPEDAAEYDEWLEEQRTAASEAVGSVF